MTITPELLTWELKYGENMATFWRNDKSRRLIVIDRVALLSHDCDLRHGRKTCHSHAAHVVFKHNDGTLRRLCNTRNPLLKQENWWALEASLVDVLKTGRHAEPLPEDTIAISDTSFDVAGHRLCAMCDIRLDHIHRVTHVKHTGIRVGERREKSVDTEEQERPYHIDGLPDALVKSFSDDPWDYMLGLRNGQIISFSGSRLSNDGRWVWLRPSQTSFRDEDGQDWGRYPIHGLSLCMERGIDVRLDDIVWVVDAPWGS